MSSLKRQHVLMSISAMAEAHHLAGIVETPNMGLVALHDFFASLFLS
ncbi:MAG: hypothetical protein ONB46_07095 [candidate division KSB1 bacterium]|nr:hypothetical protein [candidate division KSB1 bacterium]